MTKKEFQEMKKIRRNIESIEKYNILGLEHPYIKNSLNELTEKYNELIKKYHEELEEREEI